MAEEKIRKKRRKSRAKTSGKRALRTKSASVLEKSPPDVCSLKALEQIILKADKEGDKKRFTLGIERLQDVIGSLSKKLELAFDEAMKVYETHLQLKNARLNVRASRTWPMVARYKKKYTIIKLVDKPTPSSQLIDFVKEAGHEMTFEHLVHRFPQEFPDDIVVKARASLKKMKLMAKTDDETMISSSAPPTA